nr:reverse transcriptase domain-containing protein [Tanacetum cinerariifolium]
GHYTSESPKLVDARIMREVYYHDWLSNPVMVKKHDGSWRMCVDFTDLNRACLQDCYPLPEIDWKVESLCGYPFKCFLDVYKGYHQIQLAEADEEKTAFHTGQGVYCYTKMPFGLKNAGATYQRLMDKAFESQVGRNIEVYVDDLVVKSHTEAEMVRDIEETFRTLRKINMKLNPKKCSFGLAKGVFLGYVITPEGIKPCPNQTAAVLQLPSPQTVKEVQSLNGKLASLNRFLSKSTEKSLPLFQTLNKCIKKSDFRWTAEAEQAFQQLKQHLSELPLLDASNPQEELIMYLSATYGAISAVLMTERGTTQTPIYFISRALQVPELNYSPMEKLIMSLVFATKRLRRYFQAHPITVITDKPIKQTEDVGAGLILKNPEGVEFTYALRFQFTASNNEAEYEALIAGLRIATQIGVKNIQANVDSKLVANQVLGTYVAKEDNMIQYLEIVKGLVRGFTTFSISQVPRSRNKQADALSKIASTSFAHLSKQVLVEVLENKSIQEKEVATVIEEDGPTWMTQIVDYLKEGVLPGDNNEARKLRLKARQYELKEGVLYRRSFLTPWLRCVGPLQADYVMREIHEGSCSMHAGPRSVVAKAIRLGPLPVGAGEGQISDSRNGLLHEMGRGQGGGNDYRRAGEEVRVGQYRMSLRANKSVGEGIKAHLGEGNKNWVEELPHVLWAQRTMIKSSHGDTPFSLTYGTEAVIPAEIEMPTYRTVAVDVVNNDKELRLNLDLLEERRERVAICEARAKSKMMKYYNARVRGVAFKPGDFVYRSNDASHAVAGGKLGLKWEGPYEVPDKSLEEKVEEFKTIFVYTIRGMLSTFSQGCLDFHFGLETDNELVKERDRLKNVGATYQRLVDKAFQKQIGHNLEVYVDDLVIKSGTEKEVIKDIEETFKILRGINMKLNPPKSTFGMREGTFLGYKVDAGELRVCPDKVEAVLNLPSPNCLKDVQKLNGKLASLNRFLSKSAEKSLPFFKTLKKCIKKSDFQWTAEAEMAFKQMKKWIAELPMLIAPKEKEELIMYLAAAKEAISAVLITKKDGKQMHIYFVSRALRCLEVNYTPMEKLILAPVNEVYVAKEPSMIKYLEKVKNLTSAFEEFSIKQVPRGENKKSDALSKMASTSFAHLKEILPEEKRKARAIRRKAGTYAVTNRILYKKSFLGLWLRCVGPLQANYVLREIHEGSCSMHAGLRSVVAKALRSGYYWPTMHTDSRNLIRECRCCQGPGKVKFLIVVINYFTKWIEAKHVAAITGAQVKKFVWDNIVYRFGLPSEIIFDSGKQFRDNPFKDWCEKLCIRECFTFVKHPQANGLVERANRSLGKGIKARLDERSKNWLEEISHVLWAHRTMIKSSNGETPFALTYGTKAVIPVEIDMPTLRTTKVDMIKNNEALGVNLDLYEEKREKAAIQEAKSKAKMEKYYNARVRSTSFCPKDLVYRNNESSRAKDGGELGPKWEGPYEVTKALGKGVYKLRDRNGNTLSRTWNVCNLKKCYMHEM